MNLSRKINVLKAITNGQPYTLHISSFLRLKNPRMMYELTVGQTTYKFIHIDDRDQDNEDLETTFWYIDNFYILMSDEENKIEVLTKLAEIGLVDVFVKIDLDHLFTVSSKIKASDVMRNFGFDGYTVGPSLEYLHNENGPALHANRVFSAKLGMIYLNNYDEYQKDNVLYKITGHDEEFYHVFFETENVIRYFIFKNDTLVAQFVIIASSGLCHYTSYHPNGTVRVQASTHREFNGVIGNRYDISDETITPEMIGELPAHITNDPEYLPLPTIRPGFRIFQDDESPIAEMRDGGLVCCDTGRFFPLSAPFLTVMRTGVILVNGNLRNRLVLSYKD